MTAPVSQRKKMKNYQHAYVISQGPVVRTPVSANLGLNFNPGFFFFSSKALSRIIFYILFRVSNHQIVGKENKLDLFFKLSYLSSNFALTLGYLNEALNNPAQSVICFIQQNTCYLNLLQKTSCWSKCQIYWFLLNFCSIHNFLYHGSSNVYASTFCRLPANQNKWTHGCSR